jgi:RNase P/RNase MRP subunit POP5
MLTSTTTANITEQQGHRTRTTEDVMGKTSWSTIEPRMAAEDQHVTSGSMGVVRTDRGQIGQARCSGVEQH